MFRLKEGTLYPILHTLEKEKLVTVRAVRRQIKGLRSGITKQLTYRLDMVSPEVVHYHNIAWPQGKTYWACGLGKMRAPSIGPPYSTD